MVSGGEPVIRLLYMTARQFRLIIKAKSILDEGCPEKQAAGQMQVHPYVAQKCIKQAGNYSLDELKRCMEKILSTDFVEIQIIKGLLILSTALKVHFW